MKVQSVGDEGKSHDSAKDSEGDATEGRDKSQGYDGTEDVGGVAQVFKVTGSAPADATDVEKIQSKLWELQRLLSNRKGSPSATYKKNAEANTRAYDLNQKTMQALDTLAEEYEIFNETMKKVTLETEEGDMLFAVAYEAGEELDRAKERPSAGRAGVHV